LQDLHQTPDIEERLKFRDESAGQYTRISNGESAAAAAAAATSGGGGGRERQRFSLFFKQKHSKKKAQQRKNARRKLQTRKGKATPVFEPHFSSFHWFVMSTDVSVGEALQ